MSHAAFVLLVFLIALPISWYLIGWGAPSRRKKSVPPPRVTFVPEAPEGSVPRYGSRRWSRAMFYNGMCTIEELNAFYATHPEDFSDPDR